MNPFIQQWIKKFDYTFIAGMLAIFLIGILNLYSATHSDSGEKLLSALTVRQIYWFLFALFIAISVSFVSPKVWFRYSYLLFGINLFLLVLVIVLGKKGMGAQRWLELGPIRLQPSELMKVTLVLALGRWYTKHRPDVDLNLKNLLVPSIIVGIPALLIIIQPDLGTGGLLILIFLVMTFYRNLKWKSILVLGLIGLASGTVMYSFGLKDYQKRRIKTFLDPYEDAKGSGYNAIQSEIAIGSGRVFGKGFKKSSQASLQFLPENHTDFVFSIFSEEHGFFGSFVLIALFVMLLTRFIWLATSVLSLYNSIVTIGLMAIFYWHTFINMAMVTGLMPIVGLPLPLMSYGGSSLLTFGLCIGIATSFSNSRNLF